MRQNRRRDHNNYKAWDLIKRDQESLSGHGIKPSGQELGSYAVRRYLIDIKASMPVGVELESYVKSRRNGRSRGASISLLNPKADLSLEWLFSESSSALRTKLEESTSDFPADLVGGLGEVSIFGAQEGQRGERYVGYYLDEELEHKVYNEQAKLRAELGIALHHEPTPHLTVFPTRSHLEAERLKRHLSWITPSDLIVTLDRAELVPIKERSS